MKQIVLSVLLLTCLVCKARVVDFVQTDFDSFVAQSMGEKDQERFRGYYAELQKQVQLEAPGKQKKTREYLYNRGFLALERDKRHWYTRLAEFLGPDYLDSSYDAERNEIREFVYWHGALEEFKQAKTDAIQARDAVQEEKETSNMLSNAKSYVAKATQKVGTWFKGFRRSTT